MKLDLSKFYNSNYKDFVHKEALEEALRMVAEIDLKDVEIDTILSITFSVDEFGENPIYVEYLDKDGKKHIVRIRPAVTNEIQELLKRYVTLEQYESDMQDMYNDFEYKRVPIDIRSEKGLDEDGNKVIELNHGNSNISFQVDPELNNEIQCLYITNAGGLGPRNVYFVRFMDYAKVNQVPSNAEFLEKIQQLEELIQRKSQETLESSKEYADAQDDTLRTEIMTNVTNQINETKNDILSYVDVEVGDLKEYVDSRDAEYHELAKRYTDNAKQEGVNSCKTYTDTKTAEALETSKTYTDTKHTEVTQHVTELENDMNANFATKQEQLNSLKEYVDSRDAEYHELAKRYTDNAKQEGVNSCKTYTDTKTAEALETSKTYTDTKHTEVTQHVTELENDMNANFATKQEQLNSLNELVQELATNVNGSQIGERTKINFALTNSHNEEATNPTITKNESYYVKVGSQYIVSVYLTFNVDVTPTSTPKTLSFSMMHDIPAENPPLTLTVVMKGNNRKYTTTTGISSGRNRVPFPIPAFPTTEIYNSTEITIYGSAITKDLAKESEE